MPTLRSRVGDPPQNLQILVVDDESAIRGPVGLCLETLGHRVFEAATVNEALACANQNALDLALVDLRLGTASGLDLMTRLLAVHPRIKIIIITAYGSVDVAVRAMARGATDFLCKPFTPEQVTVAVARAAALRAVEEDVAIVPDRLGTAGPEADFATTSATLQEAITTVRRMAPTDIPMLVSGEPGTGKSVLARAVHAWGRRPEGPHLVFDCAARSPAYADLAIFGDAVAGEQLISHAEPPLVQQAQGGTLLIKHIEVLSQRAQERLVHLIETRTLDLPGAPTSAPSDCRILATTATQASGLSPALATLLERIHVTLPPLRERVEDIPALIQRYVAFARVESGKQVFGCSVEALDRLVSYPWPGNLRELHDVVRRAFTAATATYIVPENLPADINANIARARPRAGDALSLRDLEMAHIREVLASRKSLQEAAQVLGLDLQALYRRRRHYGLE